MANNLGIKIKVDFSSIENLEKKLNQLMKNDIALNVKVNDKAALNRLSAFEDKFLKVKSTLEKGIDIKLNTGANSLEKMLNSVTQSGEITNRTIRDIDTQVNNMASDLGKSDSLISSMTKTMKYLNDGTKSTTTSVTKMLNAFEKETNVSVDGQQKSLKVAADRNNALKDIASTMKEINTLEQKSVGADDKTKSAIQNRVSGLKAELAEMKTAYKGVFGASADDSSMISQQKALGDYNLKIKEISKEKQAQAQYDKETEGVLRNLVQIENERYSLIKRAETAGDNEANVLRKQASMLEDKSAALVKQSGLYERVNVEQLRSLNILSQENNAAMELSRTLATAKGLDREKIEASANAFKSVKDQMKDVYSIQQKLQGLQAGQGAGVLNGKEETQLNILQQELRVKQELLNATRNQASEEGTLSQKQQQALSSLEQEKTAKLESARATAEINAEARQTSQLYDEVASSMKRVSSLSESLAHAGSSEKSVIQDIIALEERKQDAILGSIHAQDRVNNAREDELATLKRQNAEIREQNAKRSSASQYDNLSRNGILGDMLNPMSLINDVQQAAMTIYQSIAPVDQQLVNIAKVADAPKEQLNEFASTIYDTASSVGKSAEEYGISVERWVTAGKTLTESVELAKTSVMGAFVGNIEEDAMVDYMSVPLNAYKSSALEATDIINAMNEVANQNAIEMDDMGKAYKRAASTSAQSGTSFSELTGIITAAQEATRVGGESIGNAVKAMDVNFGKMASGITKGDQNKTAFFKNIGVDVKDSNGELKSTYDILSDLQKVWGDLSTDQKSTAGFYAAGKNFQNVFAGVMGNWGTVTKAMNEAQGQVDLLDKKSGSAFQEFGKQQDSIQFKAANLKNSWDEFLNAVTGGKDGVTQVMAALSDGLQQATELAKDPGIRQFALSIAKIVALMTGVTAAKSFFSIITKGSLGALGSLKNLIPAFKGLSKASALEGSVTGFGSLLSIGGKFIPVVGGIITALELLDATGVPVWETMGKGIKEVDDFLHKGQKGLREYAETQKEATKQLNDNLILNGAIEAVDKTIKSYEDLRATKEKAYSGGDKNAKTYSQEEFANIQKQFNDTAESLGFDLKITWNDYDNIESHFQQLIKLKNALTTDEAIDLSEGLGKKAKYAKAADLTSNIENTGDNKGGNRGLSTERLAIDEKMESTYQNIREEGEKELAEFNRRVSYNLGKFDTDIMEKAEKTNSKRLRELAADRKQLVDSAVAGTLQEGFAGLSEKDQKMNIALLSSELPLLGKKQAAYGDIIEKIKNGQKLNEQESQTIAELDSTYAGLSSSTSAWVDDQKNGILKMLEETGKAGTQSTQDLENALRQLGEMSGMSKDEINSMIETSKAGGQGFVDMMAKQGEMGASILGITERLKVQADDFGISWGDMASNIQSQIEAIPDDKVTKFSLVQENGIANWDEIDSVLSLPEELVTKYKLIDESGNVDIQNVVQLLDTLPPEVIQKYKLDVNGDGVVKISEIQQTWEKMPDEDRKKFVAELTANDEGFNAKVDNTKSKAAEVNKIKGVIQLSANDVSTPVIASAKQFASTLSNGNYTAMLKANPDSANTSIADINGKLYAYNQLQPSARLNADNQDALTKYAAAHGVMVTFDAETGTASFNGDASNLNSVYSGQVVPKKGNTSSTHTFQALLTGAWDKVTQFFGGGSSSVSIAPPASALAQANKSSSAAIMTPQLGKSLSASIGSAVGQSIATGAATSQSKSSSSGSSARVDSDVWRYWSKELFKGLPLENSMDALKTSIDQAGEDQNKLMTLYRRQITLLDQQIAYQKELKGAQQSELSSVISQLRKYGFSARGNQITNFGRASSLKGDKATEAETLLNRYKELYQSINDLNGAISDLNSDKRAAQEEINDAKLNQELKGITSSLKRTEALMTSIENNTSIQAKKEEFIGDSDFELALTVKEQGMNTAKGNVSKLVDEYNRLAKSTVNYGENAKELMDQMSDLKSSILDNADAILTYREDLKTLEIDRLTSDYEKFSDIISDSIDRISNNIDNLKEGLLSGTTLTDLASSQFGILDLNRKSKLEQQQQQRLDLEAELDASLAAYDKARVERTQRVANNILTIEKSKYNNLLAMAKSFNDGKIISPATAITEKIDIGKIAVDISPNKSSYDSWKNTLKTINDGYSREYDAIIQKYTKSIAQASTQAEKEALRGNSILEQLKLQESMYRNIIKTNEQMIAKSKEELKNTTLTTDQITQLEEAIKDYQQASIDAQNSIKETIQSRYDYEFDLIDQYSEKAKGYAENLEYLLNVADLTNANKEVKESIYESIFAAKSNEYNLAKNSLGALINEQKKFEQGSYEWNLLKDKIDDVRSSMQDLTVDTLNANKDLLGSALDVIQSDLEKGILNGKTSDQWKDFADNWTEGISKEIELDKLRSRLLENEDDTLNRRLEVLDKQEAVSKVDLEYMDKQLSVLELQNKLRSIENERSVQTLVRGDDGKWAWQYVADQSAFDKTNEDLQKAQLDLQEYQSDQRKGYVDAVGDVLDNARNGKYSTTDELRAALDNARSMYGNVLSDIPGISPDASQEEILAAYQAYLQANGYVVNDSLGMEGTALSPEALASWGTQFETSFMNISETLGQIIGTELINALTALSGQGTTGIGSTYTVSIGSLEFPGVTDAAGMEAFFADLPNVIDQLVHSK